MKKTTRQNRILSALLAFAMVLSLLPETLFPVARAIEFDVTQSLDIDGVSGEFEIIFETSATGTTLTPAYFALIPDIGVAPGATVSDIVASSGQVASGGFLTWLQNTSGQVALTDLSVGKIIESGDITSMLSVVNKKVVITQDTFGSALPSLGDVYSKLKDVYGSEGFYVRGNSTLITDPTTQLKDTGIPYVAVLYSQGGTPFYNIALGTYKAAVIGKADLVPKDYVLNKGTSQFTAANADASNLEFANDTTWEGTVTNKGTGNALLQKMEIFLQNRTGANQDVSNYVLCSVKNDLSTKLTPLVSYLEPGKTYYLALAPDKNISATNFPLSGYVKLYYQDVGQKTDSILVVPVRVNGENGNNPGLSIGSVWIKGTAGQLAITDDTMKPDMVSHTITGSTSALKYNGPYMTSKQATPVDHVVKGVNTTLDHQWVTILPSEIGDIGNVTPIGNRKLEIALTEKAQELGPGLYVETLKYEFGRKNGSGTYQTQTEYFTVYLEIEGAEAVIPTLSRQSGDKSDYDANSGNTSRTQPTFDYTTGSWGPIISVALKAQDGTVYNLNSSDWTATTPDASGAGTLTLKNSALDKLNLGKFTYATVQATFGTPPDGRDNSTQEARMNIKSAFPVTINVTTDIDNTSHGEITLVPVGGGTAITVQAAGTVNKAGASYKYTGTATKAGTTYTVHVDGNPTTETVSVTDQSATINYRTVTVHGGTGAGNVGIGTSASAAQTSATSKADKDLTVLIDLATPQVVYLYAQPDTGYTGTAAWTSSGDAVATTPANATTINKVTKTTTATASYNSFTAHVYTKFADGSATTRTDVTSVKLCLADGSGEVAYDTTSSSGNDWAFALSGTQAYSYAKVTTSSGTYVGALSGTLNAANQSRDLILYKVTTAKATTWPGGATTAPAGATDVNAAATATADTKATAIAPANAQITMAATPDKGYTFKNWTGGTVTNGKYTVGTADVTLTANFEAIQVTLNDLGSTNWSYGDKRTQSIPATANKGTATSVSYSVTNTGSLPKWLQASGVISTGANVSINNGQPNKVETGIKVTVQATSSNGTTASKDYTINVQKITPTLTLTGRGVPYYAGEAVPGSGSNATIKTVTLNSGTYYAGDPDAAYNASNWKTLALTDVTSQPTYDKSSLVAGSNPITATLPLNQVPTITGSTAQLDAVWNAVTGSITLQVTAAVSVHVAVYRDTTTAYNIHAGDTVTLTDKSDSSKKFIGVIPASTGTDVTIPSVPSGTYTVTVGSVTGPDLTVAAADPTEYRLDYYTLTIGSDSNGSIAWTSGMDVADNGIYLKGTKFGVTANHNSGYHFKNWTTGTGNQITPGGSNVYTPAGGLQNTTIWTANFDPNTVTINKNLNGTADSTTSRTVALHLITGGTPAAAATKTGTYTGATATITAVPDGTYAIYDTKGDTGLRVTVDSNDPAAVTIQYYTVKYAVTPTNGSYTGAHADDEVISNGSDARKTVTLPAVKPAANYAFQNWTSAPNCGTPTVSTDTTTKVTTGTWKITSSPAASAVDTNHGILLTPNFSRSGGSIKVIVKKDNVLQGSNATTAPSVTVKYTGPGGSSGSAVTDNTGAVTFTDLAAGTYTFTVNDGTRDWRDTVQIASSNDDVDRTLEYFTVTAVAGSPSAQSASVTAPAAGIVLKGKTATLTSAAASGYGGSVTWTLAKTNGNGSSAVSGNTVTVHDTVVATATYTRNDIKITAYKNGDATLASGRTIKLMSGTTEVGSAVTDASGVATFTAVPHLDTGSYAIHDNKGDTGLTVNATAGGTHSSTKLYYYEVVFVGLTPATDMGKYGTANATPATQEVLVNGSGSVGTVRRTVSMPQTTPNTNYVRAAWTITPSSGAGTAPGANIGAGTSDTWAPASNYTGKTDIKLKPNFSKNSASLEVTVTLDGTTVPDNTVVTLTPTTGATKTEPTTGGVATFTGLTAGNYTLTVTGIGHGQQAVIISGTTDGRATLNFFTVTTDKGTGAATAYVGATSGFTGTDTSMAFLEDKTGNSNNKAYVKATPLNGFNSSSLSWTLTKTDSPTTTADSTESGGIITVKDKVTATASYTENPITLGPGTGRVTYGQTISSLTTDPAVGKPYAGDTITYKVKGSDGIYGGNARTINGITLTPTTSGWTVSGSPTSASAANRTVVFEIEVTSTATGKKATNTVTITVDKAKLNKVDVTNVIVPIPGNAPDPVADLPDGPGYLDNTTGNDDVDSATVTWTPGDDPFQYGKEYTASVTVKPDDNHEFENTVTGTVNGMTAKTATKNADGTVTVTYTFPAIYKLVYSPNGGTGGTQPADSNIKLGDSITIAGDPGYTRSGWNGSKGWAVTATAAKSYDFNKTGVTVDSTMLGRAVNGVVTLYYVWESSEMSSPDVELVAVYDMNNTQWTTGTATYQGRNYTGLVAPGAITVTGDSIDWEHLSYSLVQEGSFKVTDYFEITTTGTGAAKRASLKLKDSAKVPSAGTYTFKVRVKHDTITTQDRQATYTLTVRPIELDHAALSALTAPAQGATPVTSLNKTDTAPDAGWQNFYNTSGVSVSWSPNDAPFKKGQSYTATIELTRKDANYKFVDEDANSTIKTGWTVGTDKAVKTTTTGEWTYTLTDGKVTLKRVYPLTGITVDATLTATAWNTLTITNFEAQTQSNVNLYYLIYDSQQTFADEAALKAAYTAASTGTGGVITKGTKANVVAASGKAPWGSTITVTDNGIVGDHTYYLYVLAEAVSDTSVLAKADDSDKTPKKLTLTHNGYGSVNWTVSGDSTRKNNTPAGPLAADTLTGSYIETTANKSQVISMFQDSTFTATPANTTQFGFVKWTLKPESGNVADAGTANTYAYAEDSRVNNDTLHAVFHRKINGSFTISVGTAAADGSVTYTPSYANSVLIGAVAQATGALPADSTGSATNGISYQWYQGSGTTWTAIPGATSLLYTNPANSYPGKSFKLIISYTDPDNGGAESAVEAATDVQVQKLATPVPVLSKVEHKPTDPQDSFTDQNGDPVDVSKGGLHLAFPKITQETATGNPVNYYIVDLKKAGTTVKKFTIPATNADNYYYYWEADGTDIDPTKAYTVEVKAVSAGDGGSGMNNLLDKATNGWKNSDWGKDEIGVNAGRRVLTMEDLAVAITDRRFNGSAQNGGTTVKLATGKVGATQTGAIGSATVTYAEKADNTNPSANKTHVNIVENTTPGGTTNDGNHSYYVYIAVAQGNLYLALDNSLYTKTDTEENKKATDWEIYQTTPTLNISDMNCMDGETQTLNPTVTYSTGSTDIWNTGTGAAAKSNITRYYDITYSLPSTMTAGTDYTLVGNQFTPLNPGIADYPITVTASYKTDLTALGLTEAEYAQFKADITEVTKVIHVTVGAADLNSITAKWNRTATYGDSNSEVYETGDTTDFYDASTADSAKTMKLEGLTFVLDWAGDKPDQTIVLDATASNWPGTITATNISGKTVTVDKGTTGLVTFPQAGTTTLTFSYSGKQATLTYTLRPKKLTYTVTPGEKIWDSTNEANTTDALQKPTVALDADQTYVTDTSVGTDTVTISASSFKYDNANAGDSKTITASGVTLGGAQAGFYVVDGTKTGTGKIRPRDIVSVNINTAQPSLGARADSKGFVSPFTGKDALNKEGLTTSGRTITWQRWDEDGKDWVDMDGSDTFMNGGIYRPKVTVHADNNHILVLTRDDPAVDHTNDYKINGKHKGEKGGAVEDPALDSEVEVIINGGDVAANEGVFYGPAVPIITTPELKFDDVKDGSPTDTRGPDANVVRIVSINVGDPNPGTYTIDLGAYALPVYYTKISKPTGNLLDAGATITPNGVQAVGHMQPNDKLSTLPEDRGISTYTLDLSGVDTSVEGTYTMTITARGDKDLGAGGTATGDGTAQATYTFALVVSKAAPEPTPMPVESIIVLYWVSLKGKTNDLTGEKIPSAGGRPTFVPKIIGLDGWVFKGWSETDPTLLKDGEKPELVDPLKISVTSDKIYYAYYEKEEVDHVHFVRGYPDGSFRPDNYITRAEVATIIARSCLEGFEEGHDYGNPGGYSDIGTKRWYTSAVSYCSMAGVFAGYPDGTFRPNDYITRQELALVVGRLAGLRVNMGLPFEDASSVNKWARDGVYTCYILGYVDGYKDGTFRPKNDITRAETVKIFNGYLNRGVDAKGLEGMTPFELDASAGSYQVNGTTEYLTWQDVPEKHWAYYEIIEASNDHDFHWPEDENDTSKKDAPPEDWDAVYIEAEWRYRTTYAITWSVTEGMVAETLTKVGLNKAPVAPEVTPDEGRVFLGWALTEDGEVVDLSTIVITGAQTFYGIFADDVTQPKAFTVSFETGEWADLEGESVITVEENGVLTTVPAAIAYEGYIFRGWSLDIGGEVIDPATVVVTEDMTFFAVCEEKPAEPKIFTVTFVTGAQGDLTGETAVTVEEGSFLTELPIATAHEGYEFRGWSLIEGGQAVEPTIVTILEDMVFYALYEEQAKPMPEIPDTLYSVKAYIDGYEDGTFRPKEHITRAVVASMIARAYGDDFDESLDYDLSAVSDITPDHWAAKAIGYCLEKGYFSGYPDGTFAPDGTMTRQEFAVVIAKLAGVQENQGLPFTDADSINKWARNYVYTVYVNGWITGYNDGTFKPKNLITRAEAVKIFNAFLGRSTTKASFEYATEFDHVWSDFSAKNWAYPDIMEATNDHIYYLNEDGVAIWVDPSMLEALNAGEDQNSQELQSPEETQSPEEDQNPEEVQTPEAG